LGPGARYKYRIWPRGGTPRDKADPLGFYHETPPATASVVWDLGYTWHDAGWMARRQEGRSRREPWLIYEVHLGSWRRVPEEGHRPLTYRELAQWLPDYVEMMGFTHVEFLPVMEHPFYGSWGYQVTGYFAPTSRYGTPQDFMALIDVLHQRGIGVILDFVPAHFPDDPHGLALFDGTHLYEHADPRQGWHPDWNSRIFNYGRWEVRSFLRSAALFWLDVYHADGLRMDAVASMLYRDYSRRPGEWVPNAFGGRENLEAVTLLQAMNSDVYREYPGVETIAEESTAWPGVSRPVWAGGLGFGMKWDLGWMHDTLQYLRRDPVHRRYHHGEITFRMVYAFSENFVLPLSHDEVVHGKGSLWAKMPGDAWQRRATLRLLYTYMYTLPGKKLLFMGNEFGQEREWSHDQSLDWHLLADPGHRGIQRLVQDLNRLVREEPALFRHDFEPEGFQWIDTADADQSVVSYRRRDGAEREVVVVLNFTPVPRFGYRIGLPGAGFWRELFNSDAAVYGGSNVGNLGGVYAEPVPWHGLSWSAALTLPPLAGLVLRALPDRR
jgi:1,4-alpha-glucan branching enzyme